MSRFKVWVVRMSGRPTFVCEWRDPLSGKVRRKTTGEKQRREAERFAARLEKELNDGEYRAASIHWSDFRERYEAAHASRWAASTKSRVSSVLDSVERIIGPKWLREMDSASVARYSAALAKAGGSPAGIAASLRHLKAGLRWAARKGMLSRVPDFEMPENSSVCGGRAISGEEFDRLLMAIPKVVSETDVESWRHFIRLLWTSGLRIGEAFKLHWTDDTNIVPELDGRYPMFRIRSVASKNGKDQRFPMSPEAYHFLTETPEEMREGFVSSPSASGRRVGYTAVIRTVAAFGRKAGVVVGRDTKGNVVFCTAHDLRRSAATRWAAKVTPGVLQAMMRHSCPSTTAKFYTDRSGEPIAAAIWEAMGGKAGQTAESPINSPIIDLGTSRPTSA